MVLTGPKPAPPPARLLSSVHKILNNLSKKLPGTLSLRKCHFSQNFHQITYSSELWCLMLSQKFSQGAKLQKVVGFLWTLNLQETIHLTLV